MTVALHILQAFIIGAALWLLIGVNENLADAYARKYSFQALIAVKELRFSTLRIIWRLYGPR